MARVLVTDGELRSALAAVRSLGRAGHRVEVCSPTGASLAGASRHARADHRLPAPGSDPEGFARAVIDRARALEAEVVLPASEASMLAILPRRGTLGDAVIPFGELDAFRRLSDKERAGELAREVELETPEQRVLEVPADVDDPGLGWPVVIKPSRSLRAEGDRLREQGVGYAASPDELAARLAELPTAAYPVLLQRRIEGPGTGVFLLRWEGETRAVFAHRRIREKPPSGGVSVCRESVAAEPELVARSERLLERAGWQGVAMVEFKVDARSGVPYLMEVNARLWGSLQLAVDAGVDFPRLLVEAALGRPSAGPPEYRNGVRCRWWWGEVDHLLARLRGRGAGAGGSGMADRLRALGPFLPPWRPGDRYEVLRRDDRRPFLRETRRWLRDALSGGGGPA